MRIDKLQSGLTYSKPSNTQLIAGSLFLLEHQPIYTLGRASKEEFVLDKSAEIIRVERGGEVTYHGPGQLVGYLIFDLEYFKKDLHWMVRNVEEALMQTIKSVGIDSQRISGKTGVWVGNEKVAAIGLGAKQWVTMHGFALNVSLECLRGFTGIVPCGITPELGSVTSINSILQKKGQSHVNFNHMTNTTLDAIKSVFGLEFCLADSLSTPISCDVINRC